jgi:hypothetical protein
MRDPFTWSLPLYSAFGIKVRMHILFPVLAFALIGRAVVTKDVPPGLWWPAAQIVALLVVAVLFHEYGHCIAARWVEGDAHEILLWPLGGLASVEVPHTARANFITAAAGPLADIVLCVVTGAALMFFGIRPPFNPFWNPVPWTPTGIVLPELYTWGGAEVSKELLTPGLVLLARFFWLNWVLCLFNLALVGFPMDSGRMFQCLLWPRLGFRQATLAAVFAGFFTMLIVGICALVFNELLLFLLALWIYITCRQQWIILETGGEESLFGYDFSQGYTSLERDQPPPRRKPSFLKRWLQARAKKRMERQQEQREAEERRMDELLAKVQTQGLQALTDEERRFLTRVSARYRNRQ